MYNRDPHVPDRSPPPNRSAAHRRVRWSRASVEIKSLAREFGLGGVILFARNIAEPEQVAELCFEAARLDPEMPLWVSIDQEGGRVARLKAPFTEFPPMATIGRSGDSSLAGRFAEAMASELKAVGVSLDYAPVLDVHTNPNNPVIGDRALSDKAGRGGAARRRHHPSAAEPAGSRRAASIFRVTAIRAPIRIWSCR